jgi:hypothetical protein
MKRLLFCWELGANFGHLSAIAAASGQLAAAGFEITFVAADIHAASIALGPEASLFQSPIWPKHRHHGAPIGLVSYGDLLAYFGFDDPDVLGTMIDAWRRIFDLARPDILVIDHGPTAILAARLAGLPAVAMGTGFTMPPLDYPGFPIIRSDQPAAVPEGRMLEAIAKAFAARGKQVGAATLPGCFATPERIIMGLPELDPYQSFRRETLSQPPGGFCAPAPDAPPSIFAYLGADLPGFAEKLQILCDSELPLEIFVRDGSRMHHEFIRLRGKIAHEGPADMREVLPRVSHVISEGGAMTASMAMAAGKPNLMLTRHGETRLNAALVVRLGTGREMEATADVNRFRSDLKGFLADRNLVERAADVAKVLATRKLPDAGEQLLAALGRLAPAA